MGGGGRGCLGCPGGARPPPRTPGSDRHPSTLRRYRDQRNRSEAPAEPTNMIVTLPLGTAVPARACQAPGYEGDRVLREMRGRRVWAPPARWRWGSPLTWMPMVWAPPSLPKCGAAVEGDGTGAAVAAEGKGDVIDPGARSSRQGLVDRRGELGSRVVPHDATRSARIAADSVVCRETSRLVDRLTGSIVVRTRDHGKSCPTGSRVRTAVTQPRSGAPRG